MVITIRYNEPAPEWWLKLRDQLIQRKPLVTARDYCQVLQDICGFDVKFKLISDDRGWTSGREVTGEETEITAMILKWS